MTVNVNVPKIEPSAYYGVPQVRATTGPLRTGSVTFDVDYGEQATWLYVGGTVTVDISYQKWDGTTETLPDITPGRWHEMGSKRINSSGTTAAAADLRWGS